MQLEVHSSRPAVPHLTAEPLHRVRRATGTVVQVQRAAHDIVRLRVAVDGRPFLFEPGQHSDVAFSDGPARPYWMANMPGDPLLEFHVRAVPGGTVGSFVAREVREGTRVRLNGPYGTGFPGRPAGAPILLVAGDVGLAAIKSILLATLADADEESGPIHLYHGVREARDLYDGEAFAAAGGGCVHYVPLVASPCIEAQCRLGLVHQALDSDFRTLSGFKVCLAGSPLMVEACMAAALELGARPDDVRAETFHAALEREEPAGRRATGWMSTYFQRF